MYLSPSLNVMDDKLSQKLKASRLIPSTFEVMVMDSILLSSKAPSPILVTVAGVVYEPDLPSGYFIISDLPLSNSTPSSELKILFSLSTMNAFNWEFPAKVNDSIDLTLAGI